jgi:hypothetical protein
LERPFQVKEVHQALHSMDGDKTLGLDGFTITFFQSCADWLERPFQVKEVHQALHSMDGDKALGLDDFTIAFLQSCWEIVKGDLICVFHNFHEHGLFEKSLNAAFIALVPKKIGQFEVRDFIPISLVGSVYKILAKVH